MLEPALRMDGTAPRKSLEHAKPERRPSGFNSNRLFAPVGRAAGRRLFLAEGAVVRTQQPGAQEPLLAWLTFDDVAVESRRVGLYRFEQRALLLFVGPLHGIRTEAPVRSDHTGGRGVVDRLLKNLDPPLRPHVHHEVE